MVIEQRLTNSRATGEKPELMTGTAWVATYEDFIAYGHTRADAIDSVLDLKDGKRSEYVRRQEPYK